MRSSSIVGKMAVYMLRPVEALIISCSSFVAFEVTWLIIRNDSRLPTQTQKVAQFTEAKDFAAAIKQRGKDFDKDYEFHKAINGTDARPPDNSGLKVGVCIERLHPKGLGLAFFPLLTMIFDRRLPSTSVLIFALVVCLRGARWSHGIFPAPVCGPAESEFFAHTRVLNIALASTQELGVAIVHCGAPAAGMNGATRAAARFLLNYGFKAYGVQDGFEGFQVCTCGACVMVYVGARKRVLGGANAGSFRVQNLCTYVVSLCFT